MINIGISGINGSMGQILYKKIVEDDMFNLVMGIDADQSFMKINVEFLKNQLIQMYILI